MFKLEGIFGRTGGLRPLLFAGGLLGVFYSAWLTDGPSAAERPKALPGPISDVTNETSLQTAVFAGGCFWGTQGVFQHVDGVVSTAAAYAGGSAKTAVYELTETGTTGHAEAVRVVYDATKITYGKLLQVFFSVAHDPTQLIVKGRTSVRNIALQSSHKHRNKQGSHGTTSSSLTAYTCSVTLLQPQLKQTRRSIWQRGIIRTIL